ncbi:hypothetical protein PGB90_005429 [Kerria lacca]
MKFFIIFLNFCGFVFGTPTVTVEQGKVTGKLYQLPNGQQVNAFFGIPYAMPPIHKYRFKEPRSLKPWPGIWNASTMPSICLQYCHVHYEIIGEEDCLYLNIFTPKLPEKGVNPLLDVIVFVHGGAFMFGTGSMYLPDYIMMNHELVYVSINYRVGVLGFLSTGDNVVSGNNGLKDQTAALKWIHHNIIQFGGNPASVTIAGSSAGGASVHYHFLSSLSDGLFQKGISFSGSVLPPWTLSKNNTEKSIYLASLVGCPTDVSTDMVKCLQKRPAEQIIETAKIFQPWRYSPFTAFGPVVEPVNNNGFLNEEPIKLLAEGKVKNLPWLISLCKEEGLYPVADFLVTDEYLKELDEKWNEIAPHLLFYNYSIVNDEKKNNVSAAIKKYYFGDKNISKETIPQLVQVLGDRAFYNDITHAVQLHSSVTSENVFCYFFSYRGKYSLSNLFTHNDIDYGVSHADDISYLVAFLEGNKLETESDAAMVKFLSSAINNFIKTGSPQSSNLQWQPVSKNKTDNLRCLFIHSPEVQDMKEFLNKPNLEFWKMVTTEQGQLAGTFYELPNGRKVHAFYGIPYAEPPIHEYRFQAPQKLETWEGIWNASILPSPCLQYNHKSYSIFGEEDCLYLNVYTPKLPKKENTLLMDVMFYIHGGAFMFGSSTIRPEYILKNNDIVFVSINYRLNIFALGNPLVPLLLSRNTLQISLPTKIISEHSYYKLIPEKTLGYDLKTTNVRFFSNGDNVSPGNNGLKDQVAALKWVQRNIKHFGGNPSSVTIVGCSAGGASVHYHFLSPMSEGLFHRGISLSGSTLPPWTLPKNNSEKSIHLASLIGCPVECKKRMIQCLQQRPAQQIIEATKNFLTWRYCPFTAFGPVIEPPIHGAFLSEEPEILLMNGKIKNVPWLVSLCKEEGLYPAADFISNEKYLQELNEKWNEIAPNLLMYNFSVTTNTEREKISAAIKKKYFDDKGISKETIKEIIQLLGDRAFYNDIVRAIKLHSIAVSENVFCYKFNYRGKYSMSNYISGNNIDYGTSHADDLIYIAKFLPLNAEEIELDAAMVNVMTNIFGNFIKTGNPTVQTDTWEPVSKNPNDILRCLNIYSPINFEMNDFNTNSIDFWKNLLPSEYRFEFHPQKRSNEF